MKNARSILILNRNILLVSVLLFSHGCKPKSTHLRNLELPKSSKSWKSIESNETTLDNNLTHWVHSFDSKKLNLAIYEAWNNNPELKSLAEHVIARGEEAVISGADILPYFNAGVSGTRSKRNLIGFNFPNGDTSFTSNSFNAGLNLSWEIDLWGKIREQKKSSVKKFELAKSEFEGARLSLAGKVAMAWFTIVENRRQLELAVKTTSTFVKNDEYLDNRFANGLVSSLEKDLSSNALASAQANLSLINRTLNLSMRKFELLLGKDQGIMNENNFSNQLPDFKRLPLPPTPSETLRARPDIQMAQLQLEAAGHDLSAARKNLLPSISISGTNGSRSDEFNNLLDSKFKTWDLTGSISQPIFNNGRLRANIRRSEALKLAAKANYISLAQRAFHEVETILANDFYLKQETNYLQTAAQAANSAAKTSWNRYQNGILDIFDTLESQRRAFNAESRLLSAKKERLLNRIQLFLALGLSALPSTK